MAYKLDWEHRGVYWEYSGIVTGQEIIEASSLIYGDPRFDDIRYKLVNFLKTDTILIEEDDVYTIAFQHKAAALSNPRVKTAIVTSTAMTRDNKNTSMLQLFISNLTASSWEVKAFDELEQANHWLGRNPKS